MGEQPTDPGWYNDPSDTAPHQAYWDGAKWTGATRLTPLTPKGSERFVDVRPLGRWVIGFVTSTMVFAGGTAATSWILHSWSTGRTRPTEGAEDLLDQLTGLFSLGLILSLVIGGVLWVVWLWYAYWNLAPLGRSPSHKRPWTIFGWVVPIMNLFRPKQLHDEVWLSTGRGKVPWWIHTWWILYLATFFASRAVQLDDYTWADVIYSALFVLTGVPAIRMIWASSVGQYAAFYDSDSENPTVGRKLTLSTVGPAFLAAAVLGGAGLIINAPHSQVLPESAEVVDVLSLEVGDCFSGDPEEGLGLIWRVDCSSEHRGQTVGVVEVEAGPYPGRNTLSDYATFGCTAAFYEFAGDNADNLDYRLYWFYPLPDSWKAGDDTTVCLVSHFDRELNISLADEDSPWVRLDDLEAGSCFEFHQSLLVARDQPCNQNAWSIAAIARHSTDPSAEFPGRDALIEAIDCWPSTEQEPLVPDADTWVLGDRASLCLTTPGAPTEG